MIPHSRARREEDLRQLRRAGLRQWPVELEEARRLAEPVDLALAQRRCRLADVVEGGRRLLLLAVAGDGHIGETHGPQVRVEGLRARHVEFPRAGQINTRGHGRAEAHGRRRRLGGLRRGRLGRLPSRRLSRRAARGSAHFPLARSFVASLRAIVESHSRGVGASCRGCAIALCKQQSRSLSRDFARRRDRS